MTEPGSSDLREAIAQHIRQTVRLRLGVNARTLLDNGDSVALTPSECEAAADAALTAIVNEGYTVVSKAVEVNLCEVAALDAVRRGDEVVELDRN